MGLYILMLIWEELVQIELEEAMLLKSLLVGCVLGLLSSVAIAESFYSDSNNNKNVFEADDRTDMLSSEFPFSAIGKLVTAEGHSSCTGTLVGADLVMTNSHCVRNEHTGVTYSDLIFYPNFKNGKWTNYSYVHSFIYTNISNPQEKNRDIAFLRLRSPLGLKTGFMQFEEPYQLIDPVARAQLANGNIMLAGYSGDYHGTNTAGVHRGCSLKKMYTDVYLHDCDSTAGSSGSALISLLTGKIVGLHYAAMLDSQGREYAHGITYANDRANLAVALPEILKEYATIPARLPVRSKTAVTVCNHVPDKYRNLTMAVAYKENGQWVSLGWFNMSKGACQEFYIESSNTKFYVFAQAWKSRTNRDFWTAGLFHAGKRFCTLDIQGFLYRGLKARFCLGPNTYSRYKFKAFDIDYNKYNFVEIK